MAESVGSEGSGAAGSGAASAAASGCDVSELGSEEGWDAIDLSVLSDSHPPPLPTTAFAGALRTHVAALKWTTEQVEVLFARNSGADIREDSAASVDEVVALLGHICLLRAVLLACSLHHRLLVRELHVVLLEQADLVLEGEDAQGEDVFDAVVLHLALPRRGDVPQPLQHLCESVCVCV